MPAHKTHQAEEDGVSTETMSDVEREVAELRAALAEKDQKIEELSSRRGKAPKTPREPKAPVSHTKTLEEVRLQQYDTPQLAALMRIVGNTRQRVIAGQDQEEALHEVLDVFEEFAVDILAKIGDQPTEKYIAQWLADNKPNAFRVKQAAAVAAKKASASEDGAAEAEEQEAVGAAN